jgi:NAD(P) transhydrogenase subunit alpha
MTPELLIGSITLFVLSIFLGLELITKVPAMLHTPLMSGANAISGITMLAALTLIVKAEGNVPLLIIGSVSLGFALFNVVGGFFVTDRMLAMFSRKPSNKK